MRELCLDADKIKLISDHLRALKKPVDSSIDDRDYHLEYNRLIELVLELIGRFWNKKFIFMDDVFKSNPIALYKKILEQEESFVDEDKSIKRAIVPKKLQSLSCFRIGLISDGFHGYELRVNIMPSMLFLKEKEDLEKSLFQGDCFITTIFAEIKKNNIVDYHINSVLLESLLEIIVLEKIHYRIEVILSLKKLKETMEWNDVIEKLIIRIESCDGRLSVMKKLIDSVICDRPGFFFNWRPEIGYGLLYQNLKALRGEIEKSASLSEWNGLPKSSIEVQGCICF